MSLVPLAPSGMKFLTARGRFHLKRLSKETGADFDVVPSASVVRVRARRPDTAAAVVVDAKTALLGLVGSHQAEVLMDLAAVGSDASPWSSPPPPSASLSSSAGGGRGGVKGRASASRGAMQAVMGSDESDDDGGGSGGGAAIARKTAGASNRSVSNESVRRTVKLHGCEADFVSVPPSTGGRGGGGGESCESGNGNGNRNSGAASRAGADKQRQTSQHNTNASRRQEAGRGGGGGAGVQSATAGVPAAAPRSTQSRGVSIRGPPGLVEKARDALIALVLGREESEISLRVGAAATLGSGNWRKIQVRCAVLCCGGRRGGGSRGFYIHGEGGLRM